MLYLLSGLPCSGKSTYAAGLESQGVARISVDEMMIESVGRLGVDYPEDEHLDLLQPVLRHAIDNVRHRLIAGDDVVLDHGLGRKDERERLKRLASRSDADWTLLRFDVEIETLRERCEQRRESNDPGTPITDAALDYLVDLYEPPVDEGEITIAS